MHSALRPARRTHPLKRAVFRNLGTVAFQCGQQSVIDRPLDLVGIKRIMSQFQQVSAQLHPGHRHTGLHHAVGRCRLHPAAMTETFVGTTRTGDIDLFIDNVPHTLFGSLQVIGIAGERIKPQQSIVARHHLIGFLTVFPRPPRLCRPVTRETFRHRHIRKRFRHQLRTVGSLPFGNDIFRKIEVTAVHRAIIEHHHRHEYRTGRHSPVISGTNDTLLRGNLGQQVVGKLHGPFKALFVTGKIIIGKQAEHGVFTPPDIPAPELCVRSIVTDITVRRLCGEDRLYAARNLGQQLRIPVVTVRTDSPKRPFSPEFTLPKLLFVPLLKRCDERQFVLAHHPLANAGVHTLAQPAFELGLYRSRQRSRFGFRGPFGSGFNGQSCA